MMLTKGMEIMRLLFSRLMLLVLLEFSNVAENKVLLVLVAVAVVLFRRHGLVVLDSHTRRHIKSKLSVGKNG